ncbi:MAG: hypothetical protein CMH28_10455 [Micavibrio sp.]|nr:hypothetical protein [Micavibrio sp.]
MDIKAKQVFKYMLLPQLGSRFRNLGLDFTYLAFLIAQVFRQTRLLPAGHPYTLSGNVNRFGMRSVLAAAANHISFKWKNADQLALFGLIMVCLILLFLQFAAIIFFLFTSTAEAASFFTGFFSVNEPREDISFMLLDKVFGIPDIFMSRFSPNEVGYISPFHGGLHALFAFYSRAMLIVGILILFYYLFAAVIESAQTGRPFGERFSSVYAPLRLVIAIMLLVPLAHGLNLGQYATLHISKWGSSFATNAWKTYNLTLRNALNADPSQLIAKPSTPDIRNLARFFNITTTCRAAYEMIYNNAHNGAGMDINAYLVKSGGSGSDFIDLDANPGLSFQQARSFYDNGDIRVIYGERRDEYNEYPGNVRPYCGVITMPTEIDGQAFADEIYSSYFELVKYLWESEVGRVFGPKMVATRTRIDGQSCSSYPDSVLGYSWGAECPNPPGLTYYDELISGQQALFDALMKSRLTPSNVDDFFNYDLSPEDLERGWAGAGIWMNKIAELNGAVVTATFALPQQTVMPEVMEFVRSERVQKMPSVTAENQYNPNIEETTSGDREEFAWRSGDMHSHDRVIAGVLNDVYMFFQEDDALNDDPLKKPGAIGTMLSMMFGAEGLFELRENNDVNPLAQMSAMGRSIMESSIKNMTIGLGINLGAGVVGGAYNPGVGQGIQEIAGVFLTFGTMALTIGFLLYYIIPLLPFMYFFFGVAKWIQTIFEAMVAVPLWALAHLKIDGDGLAGPAAANGYYLLLEIFIRPFLVIMGMIASISIFTAMAFIMNDLWDLVTVNITGYDRYTGSDDGAMKFLDIEYYRSGVDVFFYTLIYTVVLYMMAMATFKLIDQVPNNILRWIGSGAESFADKIEDNTEQLIRYSAIGGGTLGGQMSDVLKESTYGIGSSAGGAAKGMANKMAGR